jgi:D-arabinose 5-phosphate isomerase GutQ
VGLLGKPIGYEIDRLDQTFEWASVQDIKELSRLLVRWSDGNLFVVGSGGSYSAAEAFAQFHRASIAGVAFATTPYLLEKPLGQLSNSRVLLISAEGKNADVLNAAAIARESDVPCAALTLTPANPLLSYSSEHHSLFPFAFDFDCKDGYLATNTLIATVLLGIAAYFGEAQFKLATHVGKLIKARRQLLSTLPIVAQIARSKVIVLYGHDSKIFAIDVESKLSESALSSCQVADYRQFAHGRHLGLSASASSPTIVLCAFTDAERPLAEATMSLFPSHIETFAIPIAGSSCAEWAVSCLIEAILLIEAVGKSAGVDPGQPQVPSFGRQIYALNASSYSPARETPTPFQAAVRRKLTGNQSGDYERVVAAGGEYLNRLEASTFRALVFDFDGTLCHAHERFSGLHPSVGMALAGLLAEGVVVGIATGRGDSVIENLRGCLLPPTEY